MRILFPWLCILVMFSSACHKDEEITQDQQAKLTFSTDKVIFDTIFTSVGSITQRLRVYNPHKKALNISSIELGGKTLSPYTITINGLQTPYVHNFYLRGGDSIYILVKVTIDPQDKDTPYLVSDSIMFHTNGNVQKVDLIAYGQDAVFLDGATLPCDTTWTHHKPYVITNFVRVAEGCSLTLEKGVRIYFHEGALMSVQGTLIANGTQDSMIVFSGAKPYGVYENLPGQWEGIIFAGSSTNNLLYWSEVKNAFTGITILRNPADTDTIPELTLGNSVIKNMQGVGVVAYDTDLYAYNSLFTNCVRGVFKGVGGGNYHFKHCTFSNYAYSFFREGPVITLSNIFSAYLAPLRTSMVNCIVWGDQAEELLLVDDGVQGFDFKAYSSILKTIRTDQQINNNLVNVNPQFILPSNLNFRIKETSPAVDAGRLTDIMYDLDGKPRGTSPDIGAYEKQDL